ncbi:hypothetical protein P3T76_011285 [Phytophthora citrophthora]|uniref:HIG1 domain-containing protein n=1 Tax=Phytophthora citrophthora TaxID=4793 RepID=A0AAD9GA38_9STRA|nr:hypothetical protein P3T76_011285 [Phytophthora citrophthora]
MQHSSSMMTHKSARDIITWHAYVSGIKAGIVTGIAAGVGVYSANKFWPAFRSRLNVSGKTALIVMPALAAFTIVSENRMVAGARNPQMYLASMTPNFDYLPVHKPTSLKMYQRAANYWYDHPYRVLMGVGVPLVGGIFAYQSLNTSIQRSQQIMHTRIYGQSAVVALLLGSMAFSDYMKKNGRFEEESNDK